MDCTPRHNRLIPAVLVAAVLIVVEVVEVEVLFVMNPLLDSIAAPPTLLLLARIMPCAVISCRVAFRSIRPCLDHGRLMMICCLLLDDDDDDDEAEAVAEEAVPL